MTRPSADEPHKGSADDELTAAARRKAEREEHRHAKDVAYEMRHQRRISNDGSSWHGHHIVDTDGLAEAFPEPETPELNPTTVRRRITHGVVLVLLLALLAAGLVLAGMVQRGELELKIGPEKPLPTPVSCPAQTLKYQENATVTVNVFNAGRVEGQAGLVAEELKKRGFIIKTVDNGKTEYAAPAVIVSGPSGLAAAFSLQKNLPNTEYVQDDRSDATVDVIVTSTFNGFVADHKVDQNPGVLSCPRLSPPPSEPAPNTAPVETPAP